MTEVMWQTLIAAIRTLNNPPSWLCEFGNLTREEAETLPELGSEPVGALARPYVTENDVTPDYLEFLREQIRLEPRGAEWTAVLQRRLKALEPYIGKKIVTADFHRKPNSATLLVDPETGELFHFEIY